MKRLGFVLLLAACIEPGASLYDRADTTAPQVRFDLCEPRILGGDAGVPTVRPAETIKLVFSEPMDQSSLRPGIVIRINPERNEIPLIIQAPPTAGSTYEVRILPAEGTYRDATYTVQLRTLLIDVAGNPIPDGPELTGFFRVN